MSLLQVAGLAKRRGERWVLRAIDLEVEAGAIVALLGPSGCGKTTLLRLIAGFEAGERGRIALGGRVLQDGPVFEPAERRRIGYVPQEGTLFPHLTVAGNVGFGLTRAERRSGRVAEALRLTGLEGLDGRYPHQLSGGQQQRTALARALAPRPALVLLDEPFSGLDLGLRRSVCADVVALLRASGATALLVTHDPQEAFASADRIGVLQDGAIAQFAAPAELYRRPATAAVARLTGPAVLLDGVAERGRAATALGEVELYREAATGAVHVLVRPEQLVQDGSGQQLAVVRTAFRGDHTMVTVRVGATTIDLPLTLIDPPPTGLRLRIRGPCLAYARPEPGAHSRPSKL